jgi:hypothetical protein
LVRARLYRRRDGFVSVAQGKAKRLLAILKRLLLSYRMVRQAESHRRMESQSHQNQTAALRSSA